MDWIKKNYEQALLGFFALLLLAVAVLLILNAHGFQDTFASIQGQVMHNTKIDSLDLPTIEQTEAAIQKPASWAPKSGTGSLFVSRKYIVKDGTLIDPLEDKSVPLHPPVPNSWFADNNLDILDPDILNGDPDSDGFSNLDEWQGKTNPNNKSSHPGYLTKLKLEKFIKQPFVLIFKSYDGDPKQPEKMTFQINALTAGSASQFLQMGEIIAGVPGKRFKIIKFDPKSFVDSNGVEKDVSELTVQNTETNETLKLIYGSLIDSPDSYALFKYLWNAEEIQVKKDKNFLLKPMNDEYKLISITETEAEIQNTKTNEKTKIPHL